MFVVLNQGLQGNPTIGERQAEARWRASGGTGAGCLEIGLVNNMPDAALRATERQFSKLLSAAAGEWTLRLHFFGLDTIPRGGEARSYMRSGYGNMADLEAADLDALIVTGCEPHAERLSDEPYWSDLTAIVDWAEENTTSTFWSCLAAHAAVLHSDGVDRHRLAQKQFGVFACETVSDDPILEGTRSPFHVSHSRWNELRENELAAKGFTILTRSAEAGVDMFVRRRKSLFLYLQGHPEYNAHSLMGECRRDVGRFLRGESPRYPAIPSGYFDTRTEQKLAAFSQKAITARDPTLLEDFPGGGVLRPKATRRLAATGIPLVRNWLNHVAARKREGVWTS